MYLDPFNVKDVFMCVCVRVQVLLLVGLEAGRKGGQIRPELEVQDTHSHALLRGCWDPNSSLHGKQAFLIAKPFHGVTS